MKIFRKLPNCFRRIIVYSLIFCMSFNAPLQYALAGPEGAHVVNGQVIFQQNGYYTTITASDKAIINYSRFDITQPEIVQFIQPGSAASVLNRILSANPTMINGTLLANGRVFFVNPAGVIIGGTARINVAQLVASGLDITNSNFLNGKYEFAGGNGSVINEGDITAQSVYLIGKQVANMGNIQCPDGYVVMAAGDKVYLGELGGNIIVEIGTPEPLATVQTPINAEIINEGIINADGGTIILAAAGDALARPIISNIGSLSTSSSQGDAGNIRLQADNGQIINTGEITAVSDIGAGGTVTANADEVINAGTVDVSGAKGGEVEFEATSRLGQFGSVHADGFESDGGNISLTSEETVALSSDSLTTANAGTNGDGGEVVVFSPDTALFYDGAKIEAKGGSQTGDGGSVEVSGKEYVEIFGSVDTSAINGDVGTFLIDPYDITIVSGLSTRRGSWNNGNPDIWTSGPLSGSRLNVNNLLSQLDDTDVIIRTGGQWLGDFAGGDITVNTAIDYQNPTYNDLTLQAGNNIFVNYGITTGAHDLTLTANYDNGLVGNLNIDAPINMTTGSLFANGINISSNSGGTITALGGNATLIADRSITTNAAINLNGGRLEMLGGRATGDSTIQINENITAGSMKIEAGDPAASNSGDLNLNVADGVTLLATTGDVEATSAREHVTILGDVISDNGSIYLTADSDNLGRGNLTAHNLSALNGNIELKGRNVTINGSAQAGDDLTIRAMSDLGYGGGTVHSQGTLDAGGNLDISVRNSLTNDTVDSAGQIILDGDAIAGEDVILHNNTDMTTADSLIQAGDNVILTDECDTLTGNTKLTIDAINGQIDQGDTTITVTGSELILRQFDDLDMDGRSFGNKESTDVTLQSYGGFVKDSQADDWATINAEADNGTSNAGYAIELAGDGDIIAKQLLAHNDSIKITTTDGGDVIVDDATADNVIKIDSAGAIREYGNDAESDLTASELALEAATGIHGSSPIETSATLIAADTDSGNIEIDNTHSDPVTAASLTTGDGDIVFNQSGGGSLTAVVVTANDAGDDEDHNVTLTTTDNADIIVDNITADNRIKIDSDGAISETSESEPAVDLTAYELDLDADTGIAGASPIETSATLIAADISVGTAGGNIEIENTHSDPVTATSLTTGIGNILFSQKGGGTLDVTSATTVAGNIGIDVTGAALTAHTVEAGGAGDVELVTTGSGDVIVDDIKALGDKITISSAEAIREYGDDPEADLTASELALEAASGIYGSSPIETSATLIAADTDSGNIEIDNTHSDPVTAASLTTGDGDIVFNQSGGGSLTAVVVTANDAGDDEDHNVTLTTSDDADIIVDNITADNRIKIDSDGAISEISESEPAVDLTAYELDLDADTGISGSSPIETSATLIAADTDNGNIDIDNTNSSPVTATSLTTGTGNILFSQTGGGTLDVTSATTGAGNIGIDVADATLTAHTVEAGGNGDVTLVTTGSGDVFVDDIKAIGDKITISSAGAIREYDNDAESDLTAYELDLDAATGIYGLSPIETSATLIAADTVGGDIDIDNTNNDDVTATSLTTGTGNILFSQKGNGSLTVNTATTADGDINIDVEQSDLVVDGTLTAGGNGNVTLEAPEGQMSGGVITSYGGLLTMKQKENLNLADFTFGNQSNTDIDMESYKGSITADQANISNAADQWNSITATAYDGIKLEGSGDITTNELTTITNNIYVHSTGGDLIVNGDITADPIPDDELGGGVSLIADEGKIYTEGGSNDTLNVAITGYSDDSQNIGVDLPKHYGDDAAEMATLFAGLTDRSEIADETGPGKAAIVIMSEETLNLGSDAELTANGTYDSEGVVDDRSGVDFLNVPEGSKSPGEPIDIAIYLASNAGNVKVDSPVTIAPFGVMVVDAYDTVEPFGTDFIDSLDGIHRLEVCSRITTNLSYAQTNDTLPYADNKDLFPGSGQYVLRGETADIGTGAWELVEEPPLQEVEIDGTPTLPLREIVIASDIKPPRTPDLENTGQLIGDKAFNDMQWMARELGLCDGEEQGEDENLCQEITQAYLAGAFLQATDLRPYRAAARLRDLVEILHDTDGTRIAGLIRTVNEFSNPDMPPSPEQFALIAQTFAQHTDDGTHYAAAGNWLDSLTEYVDILTTDIGWSHEESVAFVMSKYGTSITEAGDIGVTAYVQMYLEGVGG